MTPTRPIAILALIANYTVAAASECAVLAEKQLLSDQAKQHFIQACQAKQNLQTTTGEGSPQGASVSDGVQAGCPKPCDFSTQLEASAAGVDGEARANSGHSFIRLKRVSE